MRTMPRYKRGKWIYRGRKVSLALEQFGYQGKTFIREIIHHDGAVVIIPRLPDGRIVLIRQYRYPCRKRLWELPAGTRDRSGRRVEAARLCAKREIQEEIGLRAGSLRKILGYFLAPGTSTEYMEVFLAEKLSPSPLPPDEDEVIEQKAFSAKEIRRMIKNGRIRDAKTIASLLYYFAFGS